LRCRCWKPARTTASSVASRFLAALVLGSAVVVAPIALTACGDDAHPTPIDAGIPDANNTSVDGPLAPPDLPRAALA
jgi:hypothetical protein